MSPTTPQVSLLMAAYRPQPQWLRVAVETALAQSGVTFELVVVDDGSPQPVEELLAWCSDPRLRVVTDAHRGHAAARTRGLGEARGEWVRYIDADDFFPASSTASLLELAAGRGDVIPYGWTVFCDAQMNRRWTMRSHVAGDARIACITGAFMVRVPAMLIPRHLAERATWDPGFRASGDWDYSLQLLEHAPVLPGEFEAVLYRRHGTGITSGITQAQESAVRVRQRYFERHPEQVGTAVERRARAYGHVQAARAFATHGGHPRALSHAARAAALSPAALGREIARGFRALRGSSVG